MKSSLLLPFHRVDGFSMLEVSFAFGIFSFCLVGLIGMLPVGITNNHYSQAQTGAASLASTIVGDLNNTPVTSSTSSIYGIPIDTDSHTLFFNANAHPSGGVDADADISKAPFYRAMLCFSSSTNTTATMVRVMVTWPALADSSAGGKPAKYSGSYETVIALDRKP